ncbi:MAG: ECF-type sigma factor [Pseudomonadota bacterium]
MTGQDEIKVAEGAASAPDDGARARLLFIENYDALLRIARAKRRRTRMSDTMSTTDVLHESYFKLMTDTSWSSRDHFMRVAMLAVRQVIADHARKALTAKRGGGAARVNFDAVEPFLPEYSASPEEVVMIADILTRLGEAHPRWVRIIDARFFAGLSEEETASFLGLSARTVRRDWTAARAWITSEIQTAVS